MSESHVETCIDYTSFDQLSIDWFFSNHPLIIIMHCVTDKSFTTRSWRSVLNCKVSHLHLWSWWPTENISMRHSNFFWSRILSELNILLEQSERAKIKHAKTIFKFASFKFQRFPYHLCSSHQYILSKSGLSPVEVSLAICFQKPAGPEQGSKTFCTWPFCVLLATWPFCVAMTASDPVNWLTLALLYCCSLHTSWNIAALSTFLALRVLNLYWSTYIWTLGPDSPTYSGLVQGHWSL